MSLRYPSKPSCQTPRDDLWSVHPPVPVFQPPETLPAALHCSGTSLPSSRPDSTDGVPSADPPFAFRSQDDVPTLFPYRRRQTCRTASNVRNASDAFSLHLPLPFPSSACISMDPPHLPLALHRHLPSPCRRWSSFLRADRFSPRSARRTPCRLRYTP